MWLLSEPKNQRYTRYVCLTVCEAGGIFCETMGEGVHRDNETPTLSAAHTLTVYTMGERPGFELFCIGEFDQQELFNFFCDQQELFNVTSNALFCIL